MELGIHVARSVCYYNYMLLIQPNPQEVIQLARHGARYLCYYCYMLISQFSQIDRMIDRFFSSLYLQESIS